MKKRVCVILLCIVCFLVPQPISMAETSFTPELTNYFGWSADEWFSTGFSRSALTMIIMEDISKEITLDAKLFDFFHTYVGMMEDDSLVVWYILKDESYVFAVYNPLSGKAVADSGTLPDVYTNVERIMEETCIKYHKNHINDVREAMNALHGE